ncbi:MAG: hypothetical protein NVS3B5_16150 [Sphingomicrobium sp.]
MKYLFRHLLLLGVILGLVGQGVALASPPCAMMQMQQVSMKVAPMAGMPDCAMGQHKADPKPNGGSIPCKDMTPGCLAMAGCAALVAVDSVTPTIESPILVAQLELWPATTVLIGREVAPELDPPSLLG